MRGVLAQVGQACTVATVLALSALLTGASAQSTRTVGTASISGRIVSADTGRPLKQARVTLSGSALPSRVTTHTDQFGRYVFSGLPRGQYAVFGTKRSFVAAAHGQGRVRGIGTPVSVADGQDLTGIDVVLRRGGAIGGRVTDWDGDEVVDARVHAMRVQWSATGIRLVQGATATTDDRGTFRVFGLEPGTYCVLASVVPDGGRIEPDGVYAGENDPTSTGPTFHLSAASAASADRVVVGVAEEILDVNVVLQPAAYGRLTGQVVGPQGAGAAGAMVHFFGAEEESWGMPLFSLGTRNDGSFSSDRVAAGAYTVFAHVRGSPAAYGRSRVVVSPQATERVRLTTSPGQLITGTLAADPGVMTPGPMTRLGLVPLGPVPPGAGLMARFDDKGNFAIENVAPGRYLIEVTGLPRPFVLKSVLAGIDDISDSPLDVGPGTPVPELSVVGTDRGSELSGIVVDVNSNPLRDVVVLAFASDVVTWRQGGRRAVRALSDTKGHFLIRGLPAGEYFVAALWDIDDGEWYDLAVLQRVRRWATRISIAEGAQVNRDLKAQSVTTR